MQNQNAVTLAVVSISMFVFGSALFFFIGCACGWFSHKHKISKKTHSQAAPVYKDLQPSTSLPEDQEKAFELKNNVAYGPA